ncbi:sialidase family protein [Kribbella sp. NPDC056861]|uniref:sialidase family protein n=1 Tax=Kribbella sp. NPDC056861 TaxID=3154857 RepID=UPI0034344574
MKRLGLRIVTTGLVLALGLAAAGCTSGNGRKSLTSVTSAQPIVFDVPKTPQEADRTQAPGDRTNQTLEAVAVRGRAVVAVGTDLSAKVSRPLFLSSADAGGSWTRRDLDKESTDRSGTFESATDVAAGPSGFVAIGSSNNRPVLWHSKDGDSWQRQMLDRKVFTATDQLTAITATKTGFAIVGDSPLPAAGYDDHLIYWQSTDGLSWRRATGPAIGLKPTVNGDVSAAQIVAVGKTVVISGNLSTPGDAKQTDRLQFWFSTDAGASFRSSSVQGEVATASVVYNNVLAAGDGKFVALVQGDGYADDGSWDGIVLEGGPSGSSWRVAAKPWLLGSDYDDSPGTLTKAGQDWVATSQTKAATVDVTVAAGSNWGLLTDRTDTESQHSRGSQIVTDSVAVGADVVLVGSSDRSGSIEPRAWRYHDGAVLPTSLPAEASAGRPSTSLHRILSTGKELVVVGDISDAPTAWTRTTGEWQASTLPGRKNGVELRLADAAPTTDGRVVAVGTKYPTIGERAAVWVRDLAGRWVESESPIFGTLAGSSYGGPSPQAVAVGPGGWVVVGQRHDGDGHYDAWSMRSKDGKTWTEGRGGRVLPPEKDSDTRRTPAQNLRSSEGAIAEMTSVLAVGSRFVAGGRAGANGPAVWLSADGDNWSSLVLLPLPKKAYSANVRALERIGNTLVAIGEYHRSVGDVESGWTSWTSKDGGLTWSAGPVAEPSSAFAHTLVPVPNGVVALGYQGLNDQIDAAVWFSRDGRAWTRLPLPDKRSTGPGRQGITSAVVQDGKLLATAFDIPPSGGTDYTQEIELPK